MRIGEALHREFNDRAGKLALFLQGRVIHETMESFWPHAADDETVREYGRIWTAAPKILVSNTRREARYNTLGCSPQKARAPQRTFYERPCKRPQPHGRGSLR
jgi:hypothetical protein